MSLFTESHHILYNEALQKLNSYQQRSHEYQTLIYVLTGNDELVKKALPYLTDGGFSSDRCFKEQDFSRGTASLLKLAVHLYNANEDFTPLELVENLDSDSFQLAMNAVYLRKYGMK
ncbi:hypothetical protein CQS04_05190 [Chryseomicrobium excrementi]|uniref:Uncharacterized protein n=1 Tax=Chryseomicrobium excrementi TaxID=2041346 RepID=A0A2M9EZC9_9BACL|nr:DUF6075 family protein [Chryseomicrobium excrementi]PJK16556.1 hypothetical protein CQS04_05190 [Chryseomicrobium excrementi]